MATAINFNWNYAKMVNGKAYDFTLNGNPMQCAKNGRTFSVRFNDECVNVEIFRDGATVLDLIGVALRTNGKLTSGEVYKADLLQWISEDYETNEIYKGVRYPSHEFAVNMPKAESTYFYGFELEVSARNRDAYNAAAAFRSNVVRMVSDASIEGSGIEYVSTLLHPNDAINPKFYEPLCDILTGLAKSKTCTSTGLHFHVSREAFGSTEAEQLENIAKVIYMENYILNQDALTRVFGRTAGGRWAGANLTRNGIVEHVAEVAKIAGGAFMNSAEITHALTEDLTPYNAIRNGHDYPSQRYQRVNITNKRTIEFRQGKGDINSKSLARIAQHVDTLIKFVKGAKWSKLTEAGYIASIPSSNKYSILRDCFAVSE